MTIDSGISGTTERDAAGGPPNHVDRTDTPIIKQVSVMMPFGGDDEVKRRRFVLEFMRIRYLIENKTAVVNKKSTGKSAMSAWLSVPASAISPATACGLSRSPIF